MYVFALPMVLEMEMVLKIWLGNVPDYAVIFTQLALVDAVVDSMCYPIVALAQATGKIKLYQSVVGGILMLNFPISWIILKLGASSYSVMIVAIILTFVAFVVRLIIVRRLTDFSIRRFAAKAALPCVAITFIAAIFPLLVRINLEDSFLRLCATTFVSIVSVGLSVYMIGMDNSEKLMVVGHIKKKLKI